MDAVPLVDAVVVDAVDVEDVRCLECRAAFIWSAVLLLLMDGSDKLGTATIATIDTGGRGRGRAAAARGRGTLLLFLY